MNLLNHTPGPWINGWGKVTDSDGKAICMVIHRKNGDNGNLIASAPDLLAALEIVISSTCGDVGDDGYEGCIRIEAKALERVRLAISKAKGQP